MEKNLTKEQIKQKKTKKRKNPFRFWFFHFVKITGALPVLLYMRNKTIYESKLAKKRARGGVIISANHQSMIDPVILHCKLWYRNLYTVATQDLFKTKGLDFFFRHMLCIPINKENINISSFKDIISTLKEKKAVAIFPEGHLHKGDGTMDFFKSGVILMAIKANVPIIPMYIVQREKWWQRQIIVQGEPIKIEGDNLNLNQISNLSQELHQKEVKLMELYNQRRKKK